MKMMIKLSSFLIILLISASVLGLNKKRDCKCKVIPQNNSAGSQTKNIYPWSISVFIGNNPDEQLNDTEKLESYRCDGVIINEKTILTSVYCTPLKPFTLLFYATVGSTDIVELYDSKHYRIEDYVEHPNFTDHRWNETFTNSSYNDLLLIKLSQPLEWSERVQPACFDLKNTTEYTDGNLMTIGHGYDKVIRTNLDKLGQVGSTRHLKEINLLDVSPKDRKNCSYDANICVVGRNGIESPCFFDNGNPLMITRSNGKTSVIGTSSLPSWRFVDNDNNIIACLGNETSIYTRLSKHWNWIKSEIGNDYCESD